MTGKPARNEDDPARWLLERDISFIRFLQTEKGIALALLFLAIAFNALFLWSEVGVSTFALNDAVSTLVATQDASSALSANMDPTDFWLSQIGVGLPLFHYYQHLPQVVLARIHLLTSFFLPLPGLFDISLYLLLIFFPLSVFIAMRRFEFDYPAAGFSAFIASLLSTGGLFGFDYGSYLWRGFGLYTQLWAMFFLPLALAEMYRTIRREGTWFLPVFLSAIVILSNLLYGFILVVSALIFIFLTPEIPEVVARLKKSATIFLLTGLVTSYFFIPFILDRSYLNRGIWEESFKYNSFGAAEVLTNLFTGNLLDSGRLPILTFLFFLAAFFVIRQWKKEQYRLVLVITLLWLLVYFGRPTWGLLLDIFPFSQNLHFHRFIGGFHLGAIMVMGAGLPLVWRWLKQYSVKGLSFRSPLVVGMAFLLLFTPVFLERATYYQVNTQWKTESQNAFSARSTEISEIRGTLENVSRGRVYAGLPTDFGNYPYYTIGAVPLYSVLPQLGFDNFGYAYTDMDLSTDVRLHFNNTRPEQYNLFNIRYVLLHETWTPPYYYSRIREFDDFVLYRVPTTGYFDLVDAPAIFYGNNSHFYYPNSRWLFSSLPRLKQHPIIELGDRPENTSGLPAFSFQEVDEGILSSLARVQPAGGEILQENVSLNEYRAQFVANRDCYLMLKTNYHPGWAVTLDGEKVTPVMLTPGFIGIPVAPGTHQVLFSYQPPFYRMPLFTLGLLLLVLLGCYQMTDFQKIIGRFTAAIASLNRR